MVSPDYFAQTALKIKTGGEVDPEKVRQQLSSMGYQLQKMVLRPGDFAVRGSIIDIYALNTDNPVRIDLFDTEVDSLRYFDASTQRSIDNVEEVQILPATDFILPVTEFARVKTALTEEYKQLKGQLAGEDNDIAQQIANRFEPLLNELKNQHLTNDLLEFSDLVYPTKHSLFDYLPATGIIYFDDLTRVKQTAKKMAKEDEGWFKDKVAHHQRTSVPTLSNNVSALIKKDRHAQIYGALFKKGLGNIKLSQITDLGSRTMQRFFGQMPLLKAELQRWIEQGQTVILMANSPERRQQIARTLADFSIDATETELGSLTPNIVQIVAANLNNGFEMPLAGLVVITEGEMFKQVKKFTTARKN